MNWFVQAIIAGITAFAATNIDDIVVLMLFFAQVSASFRPKHIVMGQYLGFTLLLALSLPGYFGGLVVGKEWIGLLGIVPIAIGIRHLFTQDEDEPEIKTLSTEGAQVGHPIPILAVLTRILPPQTYYVAAITVANGGDNIGIYVPLFASSSLASLGVILAVFFLLVGGWCLIAYQLARHPVIAYGLTRYGDRLVPFVLIGLGLFILFDSETYRLLPMFAAAPR